MYILKNSLPHGLEGGGIICEDLGEEIKNLTSKGNSYDLYNTLQNFIFSSRKIIFFPKLSEKNLEIIFLYAQTHPIYTPA